MKGKLEVVSGMSDSQKIMMSLLPFLPKKMILKLTKQMQEEK
jgi:hypothetical protein